MAPLAIGSQSSAYGTFSTASGDSSVAIGDSAQAAEEGAVAMGWGAAASGPNAIGTGTSANFANSAAFGTGATATRADQIVLGTGTTTYTAPGITSAASRSEQSGPTQIVTSDAQGNLATADFSVDLLQRQLGQFHSQISANRTEARQGIAAAMALTTAPMPSAVGRTSWAMNAAIFRGEAAVGASLAHRLNTIVPLAITGGYAYGGGKSHGARVGMQGEF